MKRIFLIAALIGFNVIFASAQIADADDVQSWNDVQITVPVSEKFDFAFAGTVRFGRNITRLNEHRLTAGIIYRPHKNWSLQPFYIKLAARGANGVFRTEHRLNFRAIYRFPVKQFALSHRSWIERRLREPRNSWRYRPSLTLEKDIGKFIPGARVFVTEEVFYDSLLKRFSRNRLSAGFNKTLTKNSSLDVFYLRQNDGFARPGDLNVVGLNFKILL